MTRCLAWALVSFALVGCGSESGSTTEQPTLPSTACGLEVSAIQSLVPDIGIILDYRWLLLLTFEDYTQAEDFAAVAEEKEAAFGVWFVHPITSPQVSMQFDNSHSLDDVCSAYYRLRGIGPFESALIIHRAD